MPLANCHAIEDWSDPVKSAKAYEKIMMESKVPCRRRFSPSAHAAPRM